MSFIDTFKHEHIGNIAGVPIYLPQQDISGEFEANANAVLLGGGSGEYSAWVLSPNDIIFTTVDYYLYGKDGETEPMLGNYGITEEAYDTFLDSLFPDEEDMVYRPGPTWCLDDVFAIVSRAMAEGYVEQGYANAENWFTITVGERFFDTIVDRCGAKFTASDLFILHVVRGLIQQKGLTEDSSS